MNEIEKKILEKHAKQKEHHLKNHHQWKAVWKERMRTGKGDLAQAAEQSQIFETNAFACEEVVRVLNHLIDTCDVPEDVFEPIGV